MVATGTDAISARATNIKAIAKQSSVTKPPRRDTPPSSKIKYSDLPLVWGHYVSKGFSEGTINLIMNSWRDGTKKQYHVYLKQWEQYFQQRCMPYSPTLKNGAEFLTYLSERGYSYNQISMARSALSTVIDLDGGLLTFGKHPMIKRILKGLYERKPHFPRYSTVWNVKTLFNYFRSLPAPPSLDVGTLGKKLALLLCILGGGQRSQTLNVLNIQDIKILNDKCIIPIMDKIKQSRPGKHMKPLEFRVYVEESKLCVVENLKLYLQKTSPYRKHYTLFLSYHSPYKPVSSDTIARWCKHMMERAGIDINKYCSHSSRSAASSFARSRGISLKMIADSAGWSSERTFAAYYDKAIDADNIGDLILNGI